MSILGLIGGIATIIVNALSIIGHLFTLDLIQVIVDFYLILFGSMIMVVSGSDDLKIFTKFALSYRTTLFYYCKFLQRTWGRGLLYIFVGSLQFAPLDPISLLLGIYMMFIGVVCVMIGRKTASNLSKLRGALYSEAKLQQSFNKFSRNGIVGRADFQKLLKSFNVQMSKSEVDMAFDLIKTNESDEIDFPGFLSWWNDWEYENLLQAQLAV